MKCQNLFTHILLLAFFSLFSVSPLVSLSQEEMQIVLELETDLLTAQTLISQLETELQLQTQAANRLSTTSETLKKNLGTLKVETENVRTQYEYSKKQIQALSQDLTNSLQTSESLQTELIKVQTLQGQLTKELAQLSSMYNGLKRKTIIEKIKYGVVGLLIGIIGGALTVYLGG